MTGTGLAQALPVAASPILTRLYTPEMFGMFAIISGLVSICASFATGKYEKAIILPEGDQESNSIILLSLILSFLTSFILFIGILIFKNNIMDFYNNKEIGNWLYATPVILLFSSLYLILTEYHLRKKNFGTLSKVQVLISTSNTGLQIGLGTLSYLVSGLIIPKVFSTISSTFYLLFHARKEKFITTESLSISKLKEMAKKYNTLPKFSIPNVFVKNFSDELLTIFIPALFSVSSLGLYSLVKRALIVPPRLIGNSIKSIVFQRSTEFNHSNGNCISIINKAILYTALVALPIYISIYFFAEPIFTLFFGEKWIQAGTITKILCPLFFIRFIITPLTSITNIYHKQKHVLIWQTVLLLLTVIIISVSKFYHFTLLEFFQLFSIVITIHHFSLIYIVRRISRGSLNSEGSVFYTKKQQL